jgi:hypothetical protein
MQEELSVKQQALEKEFECAKQARDDSQWEASRLRESLEESKRIQQQEAKQRVWRC